MILEIIQANYTLPEHAHAIVQLMDEYACDPMGGGKGLSDYAKINLVAALGKCAIACGNFGGGDYRS